MTGLVCAETGSTKKLRVRAHAGLRGVAFGCVEVCVNGRVIKPAVWERVAMAAQSFAVLYVRVLFCCQVVGVTSLGLTNAPHKKQPSLPEGCALYARRSC